MKNPKSVSKRGFTLVEIIIAIVVVSAIVAAVIPLFIKSVTLNKSAKNKLLAYELTHKKIEDLRNISFEDIDNSTFPVYDIPNASGTIEVSDDIDDDGFDEVDIKKITVTTNWQEKSGNKNTQFITYITKQGISSK